ncbi:hypothetical protein ACFSN5_05565 [Streptococcus tangpeifui]|uniref:hypothetical protein n=1 Tax=Streptococcus tangpeifui TaxID=2709400 RepID=UPI0013EC2B29|nr:MULTISPECIES: hypothetical protein [unclassified Streptococcus]
MRTYRRFTVTSLITLMLIIWLGFFLSIALWKIIFLGVINFILDYLAYRVAYEESSGSELTLRETLQGFYRLIGNKYSLVFLGLVLITVIYDYVTHKPQIDNYFFISLLIMTCGIQFISASNGRSKKCQ